MEIDIVGEIIEREIGNVRPYTAPGRLVDLVEEVEWRFHYGGVVKCEWCRDVLLRMGIASLYFADTSRGERG